MGNEQERLHLLLERYRKGQDEAVLTLSLMEGLHATLDPEGRNWLLQFMWLEVLADFQKAVKGEGSQHWIFQVAIPLWVKFGDTEFMTNGLLRMLDPGETSVAREWATHISGLLCDALRRYSNRFNDITISRIQAFAADVEFATNTQLDNYRFEPDVVKAFHRISEIINNRRFAPVMQDLLAARNAAQSGAKLDTPPTLSSKPSVRVTKDYSDPIPGSLEEIDKDIDYWTGRLGEGEPGSNHEYWVGSRLTKLRHARTRLLENKTTTHGGDREFALLALEEARKSNPEEDGRIHPKVGAVVVKDGHVLAVAHRGEFPGCHAEYVALEKKLVDVPVSGATVYTTLEPCTSRNHPKIPCASRLVERRVARVVIGMLDPNPEITGRGQLRLREGRVATDLFPNDLMDEVEELNRDFTRLHQATSDSIRQSNAKGNNPPQVLGGSGATDAISIPPDKPFNWGQIDHTLVGLKFTDLSGDIRREIDADERRIRHENRNNRNAATVPSQLLEMQERRTDEWASRTLEIYCDVWKLQGHSRSASFLRAVYASGIMPLIQARTSSVISAFELFAKRTNYPSNLISAQLRGFRMKMRQLESRWKRRLEIEAKECEHADRAKTRVRSAPQLPRKSPTTRGGDLGDTEKTPASQAEKRRPTEVLYSYSHTDEKLREELGRHLSPLEREGMIISWHDRKIGAGREVDSEIDTHLENADLFLLLVSPDFIASDYCYGKEVKRALERHNAGTARVIPIILRPVDWRKTPFGKLLALPTDGKPVTTWSNRDEAFLNVAQGVRHAVNEIIDQGPGQESSLKLAIKSVSYNRDFGGIAIVAEIHNPTPSFHQLTEWSLKIRVPDLILQGGRGRTSFLCGADWWASPPFDLGPNKMTRGAVFFPCDPSWREQLPAEPLNGRLVAHVFQSSPLEQEVEIYSLKTLREREAKEALSGIKSKALPSNRPEIAITGWGPNKNPDRPEYQAQCGFYLHNSGLETAIAIRVQEFQLPFEIPDVWTCVEAPFIDRTKDGFLPIYRKLGGRLDKWDLEGFLRDAYRDKGPGNKTISITVRYRDAERGYMTYQDLVFSPELRRIVSFGAPRQELDTEVPH